MKEASPLRRACARTSAARCERNTSVSWCAWWMGAPQPQPGRPLVFVDLRDRAGIVQVSFDPRAANAEAMAVVERLAVESVVLVEGAVVARPVDGLNPDPETGDIEVRGASIRVVGPAVTSAIPVARGKGEKLAAEELRLKYRVLTCGASNCSATWC